MTSIKFAVDQCVLAGNSMAQELMDTIAQREDEIQQLKARLNAVLPMAHIPDVILEEIFFQLVRDAHLGFKSTGGPSVNGTYAQWIHITLVCRRWKELVLNAPRLWTFLEYTPNHACMRSVLARSKSAPIQIMTLPLPVMLSGPGVFDETFAAVKELVSHLHRTCQFYFSDRAHRQNIMKGLEGTVVQAPWLRSIHLSRLDMGPPTADNVPLFSGSDFPRLQELDLSFCSLQVLQAVARPSMTSLAIHVSNEQIPDGYPQFIHDTTSLLNVLKGMPLLRSFVLKEWIFNPPPPPSPSGFVSPPHVQLPHLQSLRIHCFGTAITDLLDRLAFPGSAMVDIRSRGTIRSYYDGEGPPPSCQRFIQRLKDLDVFSTSSMHRLVLSKQGISWVTVTGWHRDVKPASHPSFSLTVHQDQLPMLWTIMPLECVQELELKTYAGHIFYFFSMASLKSLTFSDETTAFVHFMQHLSLPPWSQRRHLVMDTAPPPNAPENRDSDPPRPWVLFPNLVHLEITARIKPRSFDIEPRLDENQYRLELLPPVLASRRNHQHQQTIKRIVLKGQLVFKTDFMEEFRAQFPDVELVDLISQDA